MRHLPSIGKIAFLALKLILLKPFPPVPAGPEPTPPEDAEAAVVPSSPLELYNTLSRTVLPEGTKLTTYVPFMDSNSLAISLRLHTRPGPSTISLILARSGSPSSIPALSSKLLLIPASTVTSSSTPAPIVPRLMA